MVTEAQDKVYEADVVVVGGGLAGAFAAIKAKDAGAERVILVDKGWPGKSGCSALAAGIFTQAPDMENFDAWLPRAFEEVVWNGDYLNDQRWLEVVLNEFHWRVVDMDSWGCPFIKTPDGKFERILVRGSNPNRALRALKFAGPSLMEKVRTQLNRSKVKLVAKVMATDLLLDDRGRCIGAVGFHIMEGDFYVFKAKAVVLAAGGTYGRGTYFGHKPQSGDSYAMEYRADVELMNFDIISRNQAAIGFDLAGMGTFQGLGAKFLNGLGEEFMHYYDPELGNRALKKTQAYAMALEVMHGRGPIYLDMTHFTEKEIASMWGNLPFPMTILERAGVLQGNRITTKVEWGPGGPGTIAQGGGARVNLRCETNVPGLYAAGDAAAKMAAGTGEIGAGALIWASVSGARAGKFAAEHSRTQQVYEPPSGQLAALRAEAMAPTERSHGMDPNHVIIGIQEVICPFDMLIVKHEQRLLRGIAELGRIQHDEIPRIRARDPHELRLAHEAESLLLTSQMMLRSSLVRQESRSELREDYPDLDNINWLKWVMLKRGADGQIQLWTEAIPIDDYPLKPERVKYRHPAWAAAERAVGSPPQEIRVRG